MVNTGYNHHTIIDLILLYFFCLKIIKLISTGEGAWKRVPVIAQTTHTKEVTMVTQPRFTTYMYHLSH